MSLIFTATECGLTDGLGGASNSQCDEQQHYVLFGRDGDGVYFEFDDQSNGSVGQVRAIHIPPDAVTFDLESEESVTVKRGKDDTDWSKFVEAVRHIFADTVSIEP